MEQKILLDEGSGGRASQRLINSIFLSNFKNNFLETLDDGAVLPQINDPIAISTDSYTVTPLFFSGGSIGDLAVNGTVNDISCMGAAPLYLTASFIIEEGLPVPILEQVVKDMARACKNANIKIVTGDTKVVPQGACDKLFINTSGIGRIYTKNPPSGHNAKAGDIIMVSGAVGDHGLAVMAAREDISFISNVRSDSAPLAEMIKSVIDAKIPVHVLRDPTRGGLATTLNEIAQQSAVCMEVEEASIPVNDEVSDGCSFMGLDPLYLANEGKCIFILPAEYADKALQIVKSNPFGKQAAIIGKVSERLSGKVIMHTQIGGERILSMLEGDPLPRIC